MCFFLNKHSSRSLLQRNQLVPVNLLSYPSVANSGPDSITLKHLEFPLGIPQCSGKRWETVTGKILLVVSSPPRIFYKEEKKYSGTWASNQDRDLPPQEEQVFSQCSKAPLSDVLRLFLALLLPSLYDLFPWSYLFCVLLFFLRVPIRKSPQLFLYPIISPHPSV